MLLGINQGTSRQRHESKGIFSRDPSWVAMVDKRVLRYTETSQVSTACHDSHTLKQLISWTSMEEPRYFAQGCVGHDRLGHQFSF